MATVGGSIETSAKQEKQEPKQFATEGCSYGSVDLEGTDVLMQSVVSKRDMFKFPLLSVQLAVVPANNRDDVEIQFQDTEGKHEDSLVQMTFHFPNEEDEEGNTLAEAFQQNIMDTGVIRSVTGNILAEFTKEQGSFVSPRGKYGMQMTATYFHMQGAQYAYKIKYEDINSLFLLPKIDGRMAFVIALDVPIRQGQQRYSNLVLETTKVEETMKVNLTTEEIAEKYDGELSPEMYAPMSTHFAKLFKVFSQKRVFVPKQFLSARDAHCVRCSIKANDGVLFPLAKSFIFINKPCVIIKFEDIDYAEFLRVEANANSATKNFDLAIHVKDTGDSKDKDREFVFVSIDRSEYGPLSDYLNTKSIRIKNPIEASAAAAYGKAKMDGVLAELEGDSDESDEGTEDDGDYKSGQSDSDKSGKDSDDSGSEEEGSGGGSGGEEKKKKKSKGEKGEKKERKERGGGKEGKKRSKSPKEGEKGGKKKKAKKDPNAPKGPVGSYILYSMDERKKVLEENPSMALTEVSKEIGKRWKALEDGDKAPYNDRAKEDKQRYAKQMEEYKAGGGGGDGGDADGSGGEEEGDED